MWVNSHYPRVQQLFANLTQRVYYKKVVLVVNQESVENVKRDHDWAADYLPLPDNMPATWEDQAWRDDMLAKVDALAKKYSGYLYIVSGGPPGKVIAARLYEANCRNKVIDFGSAVDPILRNKVTRGYHQPDHPHAKQVDPMWVVPVHEADPMPRNF